ncbi:quinoprotein relay system zinc metallohydrolase 2 [Amaricoccus sp.]|uniref:quinoprotein relay system zinc metallohydrolase 2 n=1 Tax=Amaricoccus sp. TaxID=1872485 RepID=UPI001B62B1D7|nr:quinoprotein relay system zinc metallohydrolase 2 [Amaricoccus sp.]MBP7000808.1 quinoprotein relay system zinc metallohydrolase 2 [Amaricoccus sp.]
MSGGPKMTPAAHPIATTRRDALIGAACLCCLPLVGRAREALGVVEAAPGVFVRRGPDEEATAGNLGGIANIGFVIGRDAVLVTDPGGSLADGAWLRGEIRARTDRPIRHVVMSHVHPDHAFGAGAFLGDGPEFVGHFRLADELTARGEFYRERLVELVGEADAGPVVMPTHVVGEEGATIDLGGRRLELRAHPAAHTRSDLSMLDREAGLLFPADLLFVGRMPSLDGSLAGWIGELDALEATGARSAVPGHGPALVEPAAALAPLRRYLTTLRDDVRRAISEGRSIPETVEVAAMSERGDWALFDDYNGRNVTQAYKELEWE